MKISWYDQFLQPEEEAEGAMEQPAADDDDVKPEVSAFVSKGMLMRFCNKLAKGHFELSLCKIAMLVTT